MLKVDFKRELKNLYAAPAKDFTIADVPPMHYLMIDGLGDPNTSQSYKDAIEALYAASYTIKFASKNGLGRDYTVPPLEGLWWADGMTSFTRGEKSAWRWTMMIMRPDWITPPMIESAIAALQAKKALPALSLLRDEPLDEGRSVQPPRHDHPELGRHNIEALAFIGADLVHGLAAARADRAFRGYRLDDARQMLRQRAAVGPPLGDAFAALGGARFIFLGLDPGNCLLHILKCQLKLIGVELFGRASVLGIAGYAQQMLKLLTAGHGGIALRDQLPHKSAQAFQIGGKLLRPRIV